MLIWINDFLLQMEGKLQNAVNMELINTTLKLSELNARDAVYVDSVQQNISEAELTFTGQIDGDFLGSDKEFVNFTLRFSTVNFYDCTFLDFATIESKMKSNFNEVVNSSYLDQNNLSGYKHYVLSTYDFNYQIIAKSCELEIE